MGRLRARAARRPGRGGFGLRRARGLGLGVLLATGAHLLGGPAALAQGAAGEGTAALVLVTPDGPPLPGGQASLLALAHDGGAAVEGLDIQLAPRNGQIIARDGEIAPGVHRFRYVAAAQGADGDVIAMSARKRTADTAAAAVVAVSSPRLSYAQPQPAGLEFLPPSPTWVGGGEPVELVVRRPADSPWPLRISDLLVDVAEGEVVDLVQADERIVIRWLPGGDPFPRAVPVAVHDGARPGAAAAWTVVPVRARTRIPVQTEPGATVHITVAGRRYGPVEADATGLARVPIEARPGERLAEILVTDSVGNTRRSQLSLGGEVLPRLLMLAEGSIVPGRAPPSVHVVAADADGKPWSGAAPECVTSLGDTVPIAPTAAGQWRVSLPPLDEDLFFDVRVDCQLANAARATARVPVEKALPSRLVLRAYPSELAADQPIAQVQAHLENALGDRLPAADIALSAQRGALEPQTGGDAVTQALYDGTAAVVAGGDRITAVWSRPAGVGPPRGLTVRAALVEDASTGAEQPLVRVFGRALDALGRPLLGVQLVLDAGTSSVVALTDATGWAHADVPAPDALGPVVLTARVGSLVRSEAAFMSELRTASGLARWSDRPDLFADVDITVRSGRVREVLLSADPPVIENTGSSTARVVVQLLDKAGNPVVDEEVQLEASEGVVTRARRRADGSYEATYAPPPNMPYGTVWISAYGTEEGFRASTSIEVVPRELKWAPGVSAGALVGSASRVSGFIGLELDRRLPVGSLPVFARGSVGLYGDSEQIDDGVGDEPVELQLRVVPIGIGFVGRRERTRNALWLGSQLQLTPYLIDAAFDGSTVTRGVGLPLPGFSVTSGAGRRLRNGEVQLQLSYLFVALGTDDVGWEGQIGGLVGTVGYKLIY